jgi:hypothetical protein
VGGEEVSDLLKDCKQQKRHGQATGSVYHKKGVGRYYMDRLRLALYSHHGRKACHGSETPP